MSRVVVIGHLTLDGVMQAPGRPDEARRGGFEPGGWATLREPVLGGVAEERRGATEALLVGRRTGEDVHSYWPNQTDNRFTDALSNTRKYVASRTLRTRSQGSRSSSQGISPSSAAVSSSQRSC